MYDLTILALRVELPEVLRQQSGVTFLAGGDHAGHGHSAEEYILLFKFLMERQTHGPQRRLVHREGQVVVHGVHRQTAAGHKDGSLLLAELLAQHL